MSAPALATYWHGRLKGGDVLSEKYMANSLEVLFWTLLTLVSREFLASLDFPGISTPEMGVGQKPNFGFTLLSVLDVGPNPKGLKLH